MEDMLDPAMAGAMDGDLSEFDELEELFGGDSSDLAMNEKVMLTQNLEGFASCFPDWDLHPPVVK